MYPKDFTVPKYWSKPAYFIELSVRKKKKKAIGWNKKARTLTEAPWLSYAA